MELLPLKCLSRSSANMMAYKVKGRIMYKAGIACAAAIIICTASVEARADETINIPIQHSEVRDSPYKVSGFVTDVAGIYIGDTYITARKKLEADGYTKEESYINKYKGSSIIIGKNISFETETFPSMDKYIKVKKSQDGTIIQVIDRITLEYSDPIFGQKLYKLDRYVDFRAEGERPSVDDLDKQLAQKYGAYNNAKPGNGSCWTFSGGSRKNVDFCNDYRYGKHGAISNNLELVINVSAGIYIMDKKTVMYIRTSMFNPFTEDQMAGNWKKILSSAIEKAKNSQTYNPALVPKL